MEMQIDMSMNIFTSFAVSTSPSGKADFAAFMVALIVTEFVVSGSAKLHTGGVVVVGVALDADPIRHLGRRSVVRQRMPVSAGH